MANHEELNGAYTLDASHTTLAFVARHAMITKVRGTLAAEGNAVLNAADPKASSVTITADTSSVNTGNADRDAHLRSADFFDSENYPAITFTSTDVNVIGEDEVEVTGDLTIKDTTKQITIPLEYTGTVVDPFGNTRAGFEGKVPVKRTDFGLTWNAALEAGGVLVSDKVTLEFDVALVKNA
ncbi:YceI family protein [Tessaracoccus sp. OS52]|uniref:YceI family protein n=1 Tax=Tessaracoccus sp. OS52 TaxID=2886691 RepID=UPI001D0FA510|nr:YceI family protein [Tessaracoccus sp. OS52]MCC2593889.1 YceI family protein [Tessaracoccus sp. OS52]